MPTGVYKRTPKMYDSRRGRSRPYFLRENHPRWKGGRTRTYYGYIMVLAPDHPQRDNRGRGYVREHRLVMEKHIGRFLKPAERVHHINCVKDDNRIENLKLFANETEHRKFEYNLKGQSRFKKKSHDNTRM